MRDITAIVVANVLLFAWSFSKAWSEHEAERGIRGMASAAQRDRRHVILRTRLLLGITREITAVSSEGPLWRWRPAAFPGAKSRYV